MKDLVVAITGASGGIYAVRLLEVLLLTGCRVHLSISPSGAQVLETELGLKVDVDNFEDTQLMPDDAELSPDGKLRTEQRIDSSIHDASSVISQSDLRAEGMVYHHYQDFSAGIASGSFLTAGMVICPCSMGTLSSIANGHSGNLIHRAADVHLKERRKLIVVPRETPLGSIQLQNMQRLAEAGAVVLPAMPGFYHRPESIHDLVDFVVGRICDQLGVEHDLFKRWGKPQAGEC